MNSFSNSRSAKNTVFLGYIARPSHACCPYFNFLLSTPRTNQVCALKFETHGENFKILFGSRSFDLTRMTHLGNGAFGTVYSYTLTETGVDLFTLAVKYYHQDENEDDDDDDDIAEESEITKHQRTVVSKHPNIAPLLGHVKFTSRTGLAFLPAYPTSLAQFIKNTADSDKSSAP